MPATEVIVEEIFNDDSEDVGTNIVAQSAERAFSVASAEINQQVSTAKQYPRSIARAVANMTRLATLDDMAAEECVYLLERGSNKRGDTDHQDKKAGLANKKAIIGPSIRLAEIVASQWGNCRIAAFVAKIDRENKRVEATGMFWDLESNVGQVTTVQRRISDRNGKIYSDDMIVVTGNAACAIGRRNAILMGVPRAVWRKSYEAALAAIKGDIKTLAERKARMYARFAPFGVTAQQIWDYLGIGGDDEITSDHLPVMTAALNAIKGGEKTIEDVFFAKSFATVSNPLTDGPPSSGNGKKDAAPADRVDQETGEVIKGAEPAGTQQQPAGTGTMAAGPTTSGTPQQQNAAAMPQQAAAAGPGSASPAPVASPADTPAQAKAAPAKNGRSGLFTGDE